MENYWTRFRNIFLLIILVVPVGTIALAQEMLPNNWEVVAEGIEYQEFHLTDPAPVNIFVARMARNNPTVTIDSSIAQGRISGGVETVSSMAERYDDALNYWGPPTIPVSSTWGSTNDVVVAINGYYYDPYSGVPWRGQVHSGWYAKRFDDLENGSGFIWKMNREVFIGGCVSHPTDKQYASFVGGIDIEIDGVNISREDDEFILFTPQFDRDTKTDNSGVEILVEMLAPTYTSTAGNKPYGIVREIRRNQGSTPIPYDHIVLSAEGSKETQLLNLAVEGDYVGIAQKVKDCTSEPEQEEWDEAYAGVGGDFHFLENGAIHNFSSGSANVRDPRTAIAYNDQYIFFIVVDGRNSGISNGMTIAELADFAKYTLGATDGIAQDGGGSSTMVVNGEVVNNTHCNNVICDEKIYLPLVMAGHGTTNLSLDPPPTQALQLVVWDQETQMLQRLVANGMMMVVVQPEEKSDLPYHLGDPVATIGSVDVRLGPGTNFAVLATLNDEGTIMAPLNEMGGVLAKGSYWWKVDFGNIEGWVLQDSIEAQLKIRDTSNLKTR